ncbi:MAG: DNA recombination protein RmuC [Clostridia bacterium]|nr:DNA recombination protein RmuC [Clostridia bacterium]
MLLLFIVMILTVIILALIATQLFANRRIIEEKLGRELDERLEKLQNQTAALDEKTEAALRDIKVLLQSETASLRQEVIQSFQSSFSGFGELISGNQKDSAENLNKRLEEMGRQISDINVQMEVRLDHIRNTMERRVSAMQQDNNAQLEKMRETVDTKLQKTLESRIGESFRLVSERLEQVYKGLGQMQTLATGVGDLKRVLSNVKTRGILGEIQLGTILEQILSPEQYEENIVTKDSGTERVEFAIKLPGEDDKCVYLPIDAKFPGDTYSRLTEAYEKGDPEEIAAAGKLLDSAIKKAAKDIHEKYVQPPNTTDFAIMFLPFEGLYAETVRRGMVETLQRDYKINIAGPTTMAALLNSLQMGFKTLAIQKHSGQVWDILGAVKTEFANFEKVLMSAQQRINQANSDLDKLIGTRTRSIRRKLRDVTELPQQLSSSLLDETVIDAAGFDTEKEADSAANYNGDKE